MAQKNPKQKMEQTAEGFDWLNFQNIFFLITQEGKIDGLGVCFYLKSKVLSSETLFSVITEYNYDQKQN